MLKYEHFCNVHLKCTPDPLPFSRFINMPLQQGHSDGGIWVFIPPKSAQVNFLWGKNDVRMAIQQQKTFIPPKQIYGYAPALQSPQERQL